MRYNLVGQDGNAFALMGYTARALKETGHRDLIDEMRQRATSGDYWNLVAVCDEYIQIANASVEDDEDWDEEDDY